MSDTMTLQRVPSLRRVALQQVKLIDQAKRFTLLIALLAMASVAGQLPFDYRDPSGFFPLTSLIFATLVWPLLVWHDEKPSRRAYHRFLPVDHLEHDLLKVGAGAGFLIVANALILTTLAVVATAAGLGKLVSEITLPVWVNFFTAPLIIYLLFSVIPILVERPIEWMIGTVLGFAAIGMAANASSPPIRGLFEAIVVDGAYGFQSALTGAYFAHSWTDSWASPQVAGPTPDTQQWMMATYIWLVFAFAAVCIASRIANRRAVV